MLYLFRLSNDPILFKILPHLIKLQSIDSFIVNGNFFYEIGKYLIVKDTYI